jgi:hypothetical protein
MASERGCPVCGRDAENTAKVCACGYVFAGPLPVASAPTATVPPQPRVSQMDIAGWLLVCVAIIAALVLANLPDNAPGSDVINLDLQHQHSMMGMGAAVIFISGVLLIVGAKIANAARGV